MLHTLWPQRARPHRGRLRVVLRARDDRRPPDFDPSDAVELLGPGQPRGLARLRAHAAGHGLARRSTPGRYTTRGGRRPRLRRDGRRPLHGGARGRRGGRVMSAVNGNGNGAAGLRRDRRRRRPQRPHRGRLPGARRPARVRARGAATSLGGACVTEELWPGQRVSRASYVVSMLQPKVVADLELTSASATTRSRSTRAFATFAADGTPDPASQRRRRSPTSRSRASRARTPTRCPPFDALIESASPTSCGR